MAEKRTNLLTVSGDQLNMIAQAGMRVAGQLISQMNELGSNSSLQWCNWHAAEAIRKRLNRKDYPLRMREPIADNVWN